MTRTQLTAMKFKKEALKIQNLTELRRRGKLMKRAGYDADTVAHMWSLNTWDPIPWYLKANQQSKPEEYIPKGRTSKVKYTPTKISNTAPCRKPTKPIPSTSYNRTPIHKDPIVIEDTDDETEMEQPIEHHRDIETKKEATEPIENKPIKHTEECNNNRMTSNYEQLIKELELSEDEEDESEEEEVETYWENNKIELMETETSTEEKPLSAFKDYISHPMKFITLSCWSLHQ